MFESLESLVEQCKTENKDFAEVVKQNEMKATGISEEQVVLKMQKMWNAMVSASENYDGSLVSKSGLSGGDGKKFEDYAGTGMSLSGSYVSRVITEALKMAENNACMKRIVASPTAGACGVLPAVLLPLYKEGNVGSEQMVSAMFVAAGIGQVIANNACISGAQGGCQAEIGSASAMAAGTLVFLKGGTAQQIITAAGFALQNLLGLVCDPVAGLVEIPCVKRNVIGAVNALSCADMALAGIQAKIPADEIIVAMGQVGMKMDYTLRETGIGGVAGTPSAQKVVLK